jgi:hypothetical protein
MPEVRKVRTHFDHNARLKNQRLADLKSKTAELERRLIDARASLEHELTLFDYGIEATDGRHRRAGDWNVYEMGHELDADRLSALYATPSQEAGHGGPDPGEQEYSGDRRTEILLNHGRRSAYYSRLSRRPKIVAGSAAVAALLVTILLITLPGGGASWPPSVAVVQVQVTRACQNPDVQSEPGQVNFACGKTTRQILWVFALLTSGNNPTFADTKTGRQGLEPITPVQGGALAWSLNLHHPYNPSNPIDSIEVAARAINNIIAGATVTRSDGSAVVQPGLEGDSANCVRYTGSAALTSHKGFPSLCAQPVTTPSGQAALVADIYQKWIVGAAPQAAQDAAVLFTHANDPGNPQVQTILQQLPNPKLLA